MLSAGTALKVEELPIDIWAKILANAKINFTIIPQKLGRAFEANFYRGNWSIMGKDERIRLMDKVINAYCKSSKQGVEQINTSTINVGSKGNLNQQIETLHEISKRARPLKTKDDMIEILNTDIKILRDITVNSVIKATGLETAFIAVVTKNINLIRENLSQNPEGRQKFNEWIKENVRKIKESEFAAIEQDNMNSQARKMIVNSIRQALDKLDEKF